MFKLSKENKAYISEFLIFFCLFFFKFFMYDISMVPSASMTPSFLTGDFVITNKHCIRWSMLSIPYGGIFNKGKKGYLFQMPKRGTPCVFTLPNDPFTYYLKRMIAVEGDSVQMINGVLHINDKPVQMKFIKKFTYINDEGIQEIGSAYQITMENGKSYNVYRNLSFGKGHIDNTARFVVPKGHVWMQGDNHTGSTDSFSFTLMGPLPADHLICSPVFIIMNSNSRGGQEGRIAWLLTLPLAIIKYIVNINPSRYLLKADTLLKADNQ